jgi:hypothetical protein
MSQTKLYEWVERFREVEQILFIKHVLGRHWNDDETSSFIKALNLLTYLSDYVKQNGYQVVILLAYFHKVG